MNKDDRGNVPLTMGIWPSKDKSTLDITHWRSMWEQLGGMVPPQAVYEQFLRAYAEPHRAYHTRQHLTECLNLLDQARHLCTHGEEIAAALWFHDAIYQPRRNDNEARSGEWLTQVATEVGVAPQRIARLSALVMATRHQAIPHDHDAQVLVDIDLAILGAPLQRFEEYEGQVRQEYRWVPWFLYRRKRAAILAGFLNRSRIYSTEPFFKQFEDTARDNLQRSLALLES